MKEKALNLVIVVVVVGIFFAAYKLGLAQAYNAWSPGDLFISEYGSFDLKAIYTGGGAMVLAVAALIFSQDTSEGIE